MWTVRRICAVGAALLAATALGGLIVAALETPGLRVRGYVSELGADGAPWSGTYRAAMLGIAIGTALLAVAVEPVGRLIAVVLGTAAGLTAVSATVHCTPGCPLPPTADATPSDVVHASASIAAVTLAAVAMLLLVRFGPAALACLCRYAFLLVVGAGTPVGVGIVLVGRGAFTGVLERIMTLAAVGWLICASLLAAQLEPQADTAAAADTPLDADTA
jgi:Protein of unknown function (DUF998)